MSNITENLLFQEYNQIIDEIINNIMLEEQKKIPLGLNLSKKILIIIMIMIMNVFLNVFLLYQ